MFMSNETISFYDNNAREMCKLYNSLEPTLLRKIIKKHFYGPPSRTLDVGCGSGRDIAWLTSIGYENLIGVDASPNMLIEAETINPKATFLQASLPKLESLGDSFFDNVLCSGVLHHVKLEDISESISNLLRVCKTNGVLVLSYRLVEKTEYAIDGRIFTKIEPILIAKAAMSKATVIHYDQLEYNWVNFALLKH